MAETPVPQDVRALTTRLAYAKPMRRGSVSERYVKCNRSGCPCGDRDEARHGPYVSLSRVVAGKTRSRWLSGEQAKIVRAQVEAAQQFRKLVEEYWQACEEWAYVELRTAQAASPAEAAKKGGSRRRSTRKSSPRSKRS